MKNPIRQHAYLYFHIEYICQRMIMKRVCVSTACKETCNKLIRNRCGSFGHFQACLYDIYLTENVSGILT